MSKTLGMLYVITLGMLLAFFYFTVGDMSDRAAAALDLIGLFIKLLGAAVLLWLLFAGIVSLYAIYTKYKLRNARPVDGAFPLQRRRLHVWPANKPFLPALLSWVAGKELLVNINTMVGSAAMIDENGFTELAPAAGWDAQERVRREVEVTNRVRAMFPGDQVRQDKYGSMSQTPRANAGLFREVGRPAPAPLALPPPSDPGGVVEGSFRFSAADAIKQNTDTSFALGLARDNSIVSWDILSAPHLRVHGQSQGSGKTTLIKGIAAGVLRAGHHVIVLDRRQFKDWSLFGDKVERIDNTQPGAFIGTLRQIEQLYQERDRRLGAAGVGSFGKLSNREDKRIFLIISEFGSACRAAKAAGDYEAVAMVLKNILAEAAAPGVHLVFEDQVRDGNWPPVVRGNALPVTGYLPEDTAAMGGYRKAFKLRGYKFHYDGQVFKSFNIDLEAADLLRGVGDASPIISPSSFFLPAENTQNTGDFGVVEGRKEGRKEDLSATELQQMILAWRDGGRGSQAAFIRYLKETTGQTVSDGYVSKVWRQGSASSTPGDRQADPSSPTEISARSIEPLTMYEKLRLEFGEDIYVDGQRLGVDKSIKR